MNHHIARWQSLTLSPADRAILDQMEEEMGKMIELNAPVDSGPVNPEERSRLRRAFLLKSKAEVRGLWDRYDGANSPDGHSGEDIHAYLNMIGDGEYCAV